VAGDVGCGDTRWWLWWQLELELPGEEPEFWLWLGIAGQHQLPSVGCRQMNIDHLDGGYEAFHHCLDFVPLLCKLHTRLAMRCSTSGTKETGT
jgi:hypothetical protein